MKIVVNTNTERKSSSEVPIEVYLMGDRQLLQCRPIINCVYYFTGTVEILKVMQNLNIEPDVETFANYVQSAFDNAEQARVQLEVCIGEPPPSTTCVYVETSFKKIHIIY